MFYVIFWKKVNPICCLTLSLVLQLTKCRQTLKFTKFYQKKAYKYIYWRVEVFQPFVTCGFFDYYNVTLWRYYFRSHAICILICTKMPANFLSSQASYVNSHLRATLHCHKFYKTFALSKNKQICNHQFITALAVKKTKRYNNLVNSRKTKLVATRR